MKKLLIILGFLAAIALPVSAEDKIEQIKLNDGTTIIGKIISMDNETVVIKSETIGTIEFERSNVVNIRIGYKDSKSINERFIGAREKILTNPQILNQVLSLQNDPAIQAILEDKEIMKAITNGNIEALLANPKFMGLLSNPDIQAIGQTIQDQD